MKYLLGLSLIVFSLSSFAREQVSFYYAGIEGWGRSYYSCDYVEDQTSKVLELFGATDININCFGGIDYGRFPSPVSLS